MTILTPHRVKYFWGALSRPWLGPHGLVIEQTRIVYTLLFTWYALANVIIEVKQGLEILLFG